MLARKLSLYPVQCKPTKALKSMVSLPLVRITLVTIPRIRLEPERLEARTLIRRKLL